MTRQVKLSRLSPVLNGIEYPTSRSDAAAEFDDVTLQLADGETVLGAVIRDCPSERFAAVDELETEIYGFLPTEAVGEPGQSEGDA